MKREDQEQEEKKPKRINGSPTLERGTCELCEEGNKNLLDGICIPCRTSYGMKTH